MKNLYILPTDKPSRIRYTHGGYALSKDALSWRYAHHIYITSDEMPNEGEWCLDTTENVIVEWNRVYWKNINFKKIILTTDPTLSPNVHKINDEFLEWFVKNPTCEFVQINYIKDDVYVAGFLATSTLIKYEIIIPKDKWKELDTPLITWNNKQDEINFISKELDIEKERYSKQKSLEQAAAEFVLSHDFSAITTQYHLANRCFQYGAKWQAERSFSLEQIDELFIGDKGGYFDDFLDYRLGLNGNSKNKITFKEWFETIKKK